MGVPMGATARILVRLPNWVGDLAMALPAVHALRARLPKAYLLGLVRADHVELARRVVGLDDVWAAPPPGGVDQIFAWWEVVERLRAARFQAAVVCGFSFEAALTCWAARIPTRIGHETDRRSRLLTHAVAMPPDRHRTAAYLDLVGLLGAERVVSPPVLSLRPADEDYAESVLRNAGLPSDAQPIFLNPAAAKTPRAWSAGRFQQLADRIVTGPHPVPVIVHHHPPFVPTLSWPTHPLIHLVPGPSLVQLAALLARSGLYVGNDSGPMHLAAALGVPTVGIYGSSSPALTSPGVTGKGPHVAVSARFSCAPCRERFFEECPSPPTRDGRPPCLDAVSVDMVADAVTQMLAPVS